MARIPAPAPGAPPRRGSDHGRFWALAGGAAVTGGGVLALTASGVLPAEAGLLLGGGGAAIAAPWLRSARIARHPLGAVASPPAPVPPRPAAIPRPRAAGAPPAPHRSPTALTSARPGAPHPSLFTTDSGPGQPLWSSWLPAETVTLGAELVRPVAETALSPVAGSWDPFRDRAPAFQISLPTEVDPPGVDTGLGVEPRLLAELSTFSWLEREALNGVPPHLRAAAPTPSVAPRISTDPVLALGGPTGPSPPDPVPSIGRRASPTAPDSPGELGPPSVGEARLEAIWAPPRLSEHGGHHRCPCRGNPVGRTPLLFALPSPAPALR